MKPKDKANRLLSRIRSPSFQVTYWDGDSVRYGTGAPLFHIRVKSRSALVESIANPLMGFPEAFVAGEIEVDGDLQAMLSLCYVADLKLTGWLLAKAALGRLRHRNTVTRARKNISSHYDLGNDFFVRWLDPRMVYSCAYFDSTNEGIETAQQRKLEHVCRKLGLKAGDRLLDIGCGWGALAIHAAEMHGAKVTGITISREQKELADSMVRRRGLQHDVEIRLQDYREIPTGTTFDRVVSIGMIEHVGEAYLPAYMRAAARLLRSGGIGVFQTMGQTTHRQVAAWMAERIFPGMYLPTLDELYRSMARFGLKAFDIENLRPHYGMTLDAWADSFEKVAPDVAAAQGERFVRLWRMYLNSAAVAFKHGDLNLWQITFSNGWSEEMPLTRRQLYSAEPRV